MVEYLYLVFYNTKTNEPEYFSIFEEAKEFALSTENVIPEIKQIELRKNDFGEVVEHTDLGVIWSAGNDEQPNEEVDPEFADTLEFPENFEPKETLPEDDLEEGLSLLFRTDEERNEFNQLTSEIGIKTLGDVERFKSEMGVKDMAGLMQALRDYRAELGDDFEIRESAGAVENEPSEPAKESEPNTPSMDHEPSIEDLVEMMEENEDEVECKWCGNLHPKAECKKDKDLGWLCDRCQEGIASREGDVFDWETYPDPVERDLGTKFDGGYPDPDTAQDYSDALLKDEALDIDLSNCVESSDMEIWGIRPSDKENVLDAYLMQTFKDVSFRGFDEEQNVYDTMYDTDGFFTFSFTKDGNPALAAWNVHILHGLTPGTLINFEDPRYEEAVNKAWSKGN